MGMDPDRRRQVLRLAAEYVERKAKGENVIWGTAVRITRLDAEGKPTGPAVPAGPVILSGEHLAAVAGRAAVRTPQRTGRLR